MEVLVTLFVVGVALAFVASKIYKAVRNVVTPPPAASACGGCSGCALAEKARQAGSCAPKLGSASSQET